MTSDEAVSGEMAQSDPIHAPATWEMIGLVTLLGTSYMFNAMDRQVFPALLTSIRAEYGLSLPQAGFVSTVFTVNVAIFAALSGWFMARFGRRHVLLGGLAGYSFFTLVTPFAAGFISLAALRCLTGVGEALQVGAVFACLGAYFGPRRGRAMAAMQAFFGLGAFLGPVLGTRLENWAGSWTVSFYAFGIAGISVALVAAAVMPRHFTEAGQALSRQDQAANGNGSVWRRNVIVGAAAFGCVGISFFSYSALYASYTHSVLEFSLVDAGSALGMYGIGTMCGLLFAYFGDDAKGHGIRGALCCLAVTGYLLFHGVTQFWLHILLSFAFGLMVSGFLFARLMALVQRSVDPHQIGYAGAVALAAFYLPGPFAGYVFGKLIELSGWSVASLLMVAAPPFIGFALMQLYDDTKLRAS
jgi:predicted MFS family arabinose efflux permease